MSSKRPEDMLAALEARGERHTTPTGLGDMVWRRWGSSTASGMPPVVMLHGGGGSWAHWVRNIEPLASDREVWVPDLPGFGESALVPEPVHFSTIAPVLKHGIERLGLTEGGRRIVLVGFSFGSHTSQYLAEALGPQVGHMVMVTGHMLGPLLWEPNQNLERWRGVEDQAERERILKRNLAALMLAHDASMDALALHIYARDVPRARVRPGQFVNTRDYQMIERLPCRVTGIAGSLDPLAIPSVAAQGEMLMRQRPDAAFHVIENAGHWVAYEAADRFNPLLRRVLG
jgi:2-hydroxy-6-oxonona-2,4-dienedioate hydrolase